MIPSFSNENKYILYKTKEVQNVQAKVIYFIVTVLAQDEEDF